MQPEQDVALIKARNVALFGSSVELRVSQWHRPGIGGA